MKRWLKWALVICGLLLLCVGLLVHWLDSDIFLNWWEPRKPVTLKSLEGRTDQVTFPSRWMKIKQRKSGEAVTEALLFGSIEVRKLGGSLNDEFLVAGLTYEGMARRASGLTFGDSAYSDTFAALDLRGAPGLTSANASQWEKASVVSSEPVRLLNAESDLYQYLRRDLNRASVEAVPGEFEHNGRRYSKTGRHWGQLFTSPDGRWLTVISYSGRIPKFVFRIFGDLPPMPPDIYVGELFCDVYDVCLGAKVLGWKAEHAQSPAQLASNSVWVENRYLFVPLTREAQV